MEKLLLVALGPGNPLVAAPDTLVTPTDDGAVVLLMAPRGGHAEIVPRSHEIGTAPDARFGPAAAENCSISVI